MSKNDYMTLPGVVEELLPGSMFRVRLENDHVVIAHLSGRMKKNRIRIILGDSVDVEVSIYDMDKGRISYRHK
jgi:translation initiation factor IF-1